jgi:hypothetical protein
MSPITRVLGKVFLPLCAAALAGCASTSPVPYSNLASASQLRPNPQDSSGRTPYSSPRLADWRNYSSAMLDPVVIYNGPDNQFEDISEPDKADLAGYLQTQIAQKLRPRFSLVRTPAPNTLRIHVTLTGAKTTTRGLSTFTRFDLGGGPYNIVQSIRGKEGTFTGNVSYAVEIFDATSNALLEAYVTKQYPNALNLGATMGKLDASRTGIDKGTDELVARFN